MKRKIIAVIRVLIVVIGFSFFASCVMNRSVDDGYYFQDFDNLKMWDSTAQVTDAQSHSGKYCTYTDETHPLSQAFEMNAGDAVAKGYKSIQVTAWCVKVTKECKVRLIVEIANEGRELVSQSADFSKALEIPGAWINLVMFLKIPGQLPPGSKLKIYCRSDEKEKSFMDDVRVEFRKK